MKLSDIILESLDYQQEEELLKKELESNFKGYGYIVSMGAYNQDRSDNDPLKGKGFGSVTFHEKRDVDEKTFNKVVAFLKVIKKFDIVSKDRFYDVEPGERDYFPKIKFNFNL